MLQQWADGLLLHVCVCVCVLGGSHSSYSLFLTLLPSVLTSVLTLSRDVVV